MPKEGGEGIELVAHERAPIEDEAQRAESLQNTMEPSSSNMIINMGIHVYRLRYFFLLEIDGFSCGNGLVIVGLQKTTLD